MKIVGRSCIPQFNLEENITDGEHRGVPVLYSNRWKQNKTSFDKPRLSLPNNIQLIRGYETSTKVHQKPLY